MSIRTTISVRWDRNRTPAMTAKKVVSEYQYHLLDGFEKSLKANAGGPLRRGSGRVPVRSGELRNSLRMKGKRGRRPVLWGAEHGIYVDARGNIFETAWRKYPTDKALRKALEKSRL